jgi:formate/nitrite transporter FocA (FNT family)
VAAGTAQRTGMTDDQQQGAREAEPLPGLSETEVDSVAARKPGSAKVVHEVIRLQGQEELGRPLPSLLFSGFAAGVAISASFLTEAFLHARLPNAPWAELITSLGYTVGFVIVIMGRLQLFTESTVTAVLPLATHPTGRNLARLVRLWAAVFAANMAGTLLVAFLVSRQIIVGADQLSATIDVSMPILHHNPLTTFRVGMPAGFLIASIAWILPNSRGGEFWVVVMITYVIGIGGFSHVVAGSGEAWLLWLSGHATLVDASCKLILPSFLGNIVGGTGLFAVLAHGQVRGEIEPDQGAR